MKGKSRSHELRLRVRQISSQLEGYVAHAIGNQSQLGRSTSSLTIRISLGHHSTAACLIIIAELELERGLRHRICVFVVILEIDFVLYTGLDVSEETEVDYETSIDGLGNRTVRESVTMDLRNGSISQGLTNNS